MGTEYEGIDQSFGNTALISGDAASYETPDEIEAALRFREHQAEWMGVIGTEVAPADSLFLTPLLSFEAKAGRARRVISSSGQLSIRRGPFRGLSLRNLFSWDRHGENERSTGQDLLYLRWRRSIGDDWEFVTGGSADISWAGGDTLASLFDYHRAGARIGVARGGLAKASANVDFSHRWAGDAGGTAYDAITFDGGHGWWTDDWAIDVAVRTERRSYVEAVAEADTAESSAHLGSYWESQIDGRFSRAPGAIGFDALVRLGGTLFDETASDVADLTSAGDRVRTEIELLARKPIIDGSTADPERQSRRWLAALEIGAGPAIDFVRARGGDGDFAAWGAKIEVATAGGQRLGHLWLNLMGEIGRRDYRKSGGPLVFDYQGVSFSLAQSDYDYYELSVIGGGALPLGLQWEGYVSFDQEKHDVPTDNGRLVSFSLACKRRWSTWRG